MAHSNNILIPWLWSSIILKGEIIEMSSKNAKSEVFVRFLRKIEKKYAKKKIRLYLDNLVVHKSKKAK
ncbi:MAG: transposase [Candidatus Micrarchaeota archaeon]